MTKKLNAFGARFLWLRLTGALVFVFAALVGVAASTTQDSAGSSSQQGTPQTPPAEQTAPGSQDQEEKPDQTKPQAADEPSGSNPDSTPSTTHKKNSRNRRVTAAEGEPKKRVVRRGGVSEPVTQIIPGMTLEESNRKREEAEDLMNAANSDLKTLGSRALNSNQQEVISQIRHYMDVARSALGDGDIMRAYRLAQKAQLLSDDLVKH